MAMMNPYSPYDCGYSSLGSPEEFDYHMRQLQKLGQQQALAKPVSPPPKTYLDNPTLLLLEP